MSQVVIGDILPYTQATATLNQTVFGTNWTANAASDVVVYQTPSGDDPDDVAQILAYPADYSVAFIGALEQVEVTLVTPAGAGDIITITRQTPADRMNLYSNTNFLPSMLNNDFGILTLVDQQAQLVDQLIGPRYNYSAVIEDVVDTILPILGPNQVWMMNDTRTGIEAVEIPNSGFAPLDMTYLTATDESSFLTNSYQLVAASGITFTTVGRTIQVSSPGGSVVSISQDTGIICTPNPITGTGTVGLDIPVAISSGGTGVTSVTTTPTANAFAGWDANKNMSANNFIPGYTTTVTAAGTTTLTVGSTYNQFFTGSTTQTVVMPVTSTLVLGQTYYIVNSSSGNLTIQSSGGNNILTMTQDTEAYLVCIATTGTGASSWYFSFLNKVESAGTVTSVGSGTGLTGGPITTTGTLSFAAIGAHKLWANVTSGSAVPTEVSTSTFLQSINHQVLTSSGTYTPTANSVFFIVEQVAAGGGGGGAASAGAGQGSAGGGGGGGGYSWTTYTAAEMGASATITIGASGAGGAAGNNAGSAGGNTVFDPAGTGATMTSVGGSGGSSAASTASASITSPGNGGSSSGGAINISGSPGGYGWWTASIAIIQGGNGGNSILGSGYGNNTGANTGSAGIGASPYGGGGDGARAAAGVDRAGGNGAAGVIRVTEFIAV